MRVLYAKYSSYRRPGFRTRTLLVEDGGRYALKEPLTDAAAPHINALLTAPQRLAASHPSIKVIAGEKVDTGVRFPLVEHVSLDFLLSTPIKVGNIAGFQKIVGMFTEQLRSGCSKEDWSNNQAFCEVFGRHAGAPDQCLNPANIDLTFSNILFDKNQFYMIDPEWVFDFPVPVDFILFRALKQFAMTYESDIASVGRYGLIEMCGLDKSQFAMYDSMELAFQKYVFGPNGFSGVPERILQEADPVGFYSVGQRSVDLRSSRVWPGVAPLHHALNFARRIKRRLGR